VFGAADCTADEAGPVAAKAVSGAVMMSIETVMKT
jgi:hypothetical protein